MTRCVRPRRWRSVSRAASAVGGLPQISSSVTTIVSTPSTTSSGFALAATALRRAFSAATATGAPSSSSTTSVGRSSNATPSPSRIARRWGDRLARTSRGTGSGVAALEELGEEQAGLAGGRVGRVGAVDHVLADGDREVPADRSRGGLHRVRRADHLARGGHGLLALEDQRHQRPGGDELDELAEERLAVVLGVVALGEVLVHRHVLQRDDAQALALEAGDDLAGQPARERVRLDQDEGPVQGSVLRWGAGQGEGGAS